MSAPSEDRRIVGLVPWLPWPLSAWKWWTEPVGAERLAALRIGLAGCLLVDILLTYLPDLHTWFAHDQLGDPAIFGWRTGAPRLSWSLLRGPGDRLTSFLAVAILTGTTVWILADLGTRVLRGAGPRERDPLRYSLPLWSLGALFSVLGIWTRLGENDGELQFAWVPPLFVAWAALAFLTLEFARYLRRDAAVNIRSVVMLTLVCVGSASLLGMGLYLAMLEQIAPGTIVARMLSAWQNDRAFLAAFMFLWIFATSCLLLGLCTRPAAILTWALSISFANINGSIDNAGDGIRGIILFYLMLCPCGAVWSLDRVARRLRDTDSRPVHVSPWPMRLLFVQLVFIYFCNGVYKLHGGSWRDGDSLFYVLSDCTLTRFSRADLPMPMWLVRGLTWSVLAWEVSFPVFVLNRWTRLVALLFGIGFHLGIFATMELGFFVPYMLCMYLPLIPWERLLRRHRAMTRSRSD